MGYTASDLLGVSVGFVLFALFAFAPGYTFAALTNVFDFRSRRLITRLAAAIPLSIAIAPILTYYLWRWSLLSVWIVFGLSGAICVTLLIRDALILRLRLSRYGWFVLAIAAGWLIIGSVSLVDLQIGKRLYFPFAAHDLATHTTFVAALARDGVPPNNPFFFLAGHPAPLRYYYFWYILSGLVDRLGGTLLSARLALIDGVLWAGLGLIADAAMFLRFFQEKGAEHIERRTFIAVSLLGMTGLSIVPVGLFDLFFLGKSLKPTLWWNEPIVSWMTTALWAPHHLAGLVAGLAGFLLAWEAAQKKHWPQAIPGAAGAALAFASSVGASIYVGGTLAVGCAIWLALALAKRLWRHALILSAAGAVGALILLPFALQLAHGSGGPGTSGPSDFPFVLSVRPFTIVDAVVGKGSPAARQTLYALFLPLNYFLEFGFFFVAGWLGMRRIARQGFRNHAERAAVALGVGSLLICTFVSSNVITTNDLGWRSPLVVQFVLLIWAADLWDEGVLGFGRRRTDQPGVLRRAAPRLVTATLILGAMGSCYELCMQRVFPVLSDAGVVQKYWWLASDQQLGRRTFDMRQAYQLVDRAVPATAVVQSNPIDRFGNLPAQMYLDRQMAGGTADCITIFGGSEALCENVIIPRLKPLFEDGDPVTFAQAEQTCRELSIAALVFKDTDPVWKDKSSWIWKSPALISNDYVRVIQCGER